MDISHEELPFELDESVTGRDGLDTEANTIEDFDS